MSVKAKVLVSEWHLAKLESIDLVEKGLSGWKLTKAGEYRLAAGK